MTRQVLFQFGAYTLDPSTMSLRRGEELVRVAPKAFDTLAVLVQRRGEVVTKQQLMDAVWPGTYVEESNLAQNVFLLRKKLGQTPDGDEYIETLSKRGYRINVPVQEIELAAEKLPDDKPHVDESTPKAGEITTSTRTYRGLLTGASVLAVRV